jgi:hypothetical protein
VDDENSFLLPVEITHSFGPVSVNLELGRFFNGRSEDTWLGGIAVGGEINKRLELGVELHDESRRWGGELAVIVGARVHCSEHGTLLLSIGREVRNREEPMATALSYVGWQLTL